MLTVFLIAAFSVVNREERSAKFGQDLAASFNHDRRRLNFKHREFETQSLRATRVEIDPQITRITQIRFGDFLGTWGGLSDIFAGTEGGYAE